MVILDYDSHAVKMVPSGLCMRFSSNDIYFLVGCLGGPPWYSTTECYPT